MLQEGAQSSISVVMEVFSYEDQYFFVFEVYQKQ